LVSVCLPVHKAFSSVRRGLYWIHKESFQRAGSGEEKAKEAIPLSLEEWMKCFGVEAQLPAMPNTEFSPLESWNSGVRWTISSVSEAPTKASDYTNQEIQYLKDLTKGAFPLAPTRLYLV
uniref:MICOS complex subunit MIC13 n=1 Tax=Acanthochromis polyacanthus TaxID=80966 RepID=A0A3Q1GBF8_9TELE